LGPVLTLRSKDGCDKDQTSKLSILSEYCLRAALAVSVCLCAIQASANTAFFYANKPPIAELAAHERVVLDPRLVTDDEVAKLRATGTDVHAYVSIGEIEPSDPLYSDVPKQAVLATNEGWNTSVIDLTHPAWRSLILNKRIAPLTQRGFNGLFLDTLDSYHLTKDLETAESRLRNSRVAARKG